VDAAGAPNRVGGVETILPDARAAQSAAPEAPQGGDASKGFVGSAQARPFGSMSGKVALSALR